METVWQFLDGLQSWDDVLMYITPLPSLFPFPPSLLPSSSFPSSLFPLPSAGLWTRRRDSCFERRRSWWLSRKNKKSWRMKNYFKRPSGFTRTPSKRPPFPSRCVGSPTGESHWRVPLGWILMIRRYFLTSSISSIRLGYWIQPVNLVKSQC